MSKPHRFTPQEREAYWRRKTLELEATALIRSADRRRQRVDRKRHDPPAKTPASDPKPALPHKYTLKDLGLLRKRDRRATSRNQTGAVAAATKLSAAGFKFK
ncbi:MAG: hypothetical protein WAV38_33515 [Xanthobacteraceae bacterium]